MFRPEFQTIFISLSCFADYRGGFYETRDVFF